MQSAFSDNFFIMSHRLLAEKKRRWHTRDFKDEKIKKEKVSSFFRALDEEDALERPVTSGRNSFSILRSKNKLLRFCIQKFSYGDFHTSAFVSNKSLIEIVQGLESIGFEIFRGGMTGIPFRHQTVVQNRMDLLCPFASFFTKKNYQRILYDLEIHHVFEGGNLFISYPRFRKFLRYRFLSDDGMKIPSDLYTYLSLKTSPLPMASAALEYFLKSKKREGGLFVQTL
jgi:hypothetical protein